MKNSIILALGLLFVGVSCEKNDDETQELCPEVTRNEVPTEVTKAFDAKYPNTIVEKWFKKDDGGHCALITLNKVKTLAEFKDNGTFVEEEIENETNEHEGNQDNDDDENDCDCEFN